MAKNKLNMKSIDKYLAKVREHYDIKSAYLFGSYASGRVHEHSDIDIAIVANNITNNCLDSGKMMALTWGINTSIEPHAFSVSEFQNRETPLVNEILRTGIPIFAA